MKLNSAGTSHPLLEFMYSELLSTSGHDVSTAIWSQGWEWCLPL